MLCCNIVGEEYNKIYVDTVLTGDTIRATQYYKKGKQLVKVDSVIYGLIDGKEVNKIQTRSTDTLVIPECVTALHPQVLTGLNIKRVIIVPNTHITLKDRALYGCDTLEEYISLSEYVTYGCSTIPRNVRRVY